MTKAQLIRNLKRNGVGCPTNARIAELFGITEQAVQAWKLHESIPELRRLQLLQARPELCRMSK